MNMILRSVLFASALLAITAPASAQTVVTEPPDLPNSFAEATTIALTAGNNSVSGSLATPTDRQDNFQVTVPAGHRLTSATLTLNTSGGFVGSVTFNFSEILSSTGNFTMGFPFSAGTYAVQVITDFAIGNAWSMTFRVVSILPVCGNGAIEGGETCDDGNTVSCDGCSSTCAPMLDGCLIGGSCLAEGTVDPGNACLACRRSISRTAYSPVATGTTCNDGLFCTAVDTCNGAGACTGTARCTDALSCTTDTCDEATDSCANPVTTGCVIGGACIAEGALDPANECMACTGATSTTAYSAAAVGVTCDDALFCTTSDACDGAGDCIGAPMVCDDGDACTTDSCDETAAACATAPIEGCSPDAGVVDAGELDAGELDAGDLDAGDLDAAVPADGGAGDSGVRDGGGGDSGPRADASGDAGMDPGVSGGCGCRAGGERPSATALFGLLSLALILGRRRSQR